jgi:hypothetical protein
MNATARCLAALLAAFLLSTGAAQVPRTRPGLEPYTPTRIEWLALVLNASLRQDASVDNPFTLSIVNSDDETILIFVRYQSNVNREIMNTAIDTAHKVIDITTKSYGWERWVKVKERVEMTNARAGMPRQ